MGKISALSLQKLTKLKQHQNAGGLKGQCHEIFQTLFYQSAPSGPIKVLLMDLIFLQTFTEL
jgi:hypothetical protein